MRLRRRGAGGLVALGAAVVFLGVEALEAVLAADALPAPVRFAAFHTSGVILFGVLSLLAVIAAVVLSARWLIALIGACIVAAAVALCFV